MDSLIKVNTKTISSQERPNQWKSAWKWDAEAW